MKRTTKDNLIYLAAGLTIAAGFAIHMFYTERTTGEIQEIPGPVLWGILSTPVIVALILERFWEFRRRRSLWVISVSSAVINVSAMIVASHYRWNPPGIVWSAMTVLFVIVALAVAQKFVAGGSRSQ